MVLGPFSAIFITAFPYPDGLTTKTSRFIFGLVAGLLSGFIYRVFKSLLIQKTKSVIQAVGIPVSSQVAVSTSSLPPRGQI